MKGGDLVVGAVWGLGAFAVVVYALKVRQQMQLRQDIGHRAYDSLAALRPEIGAPSPISVPLPRVVF